MEFIYYGRSELINEIALLRKGLLLKLLVLFLVILSGFLFFFWDRDNEILDVGGRR